MPKGILLALSNPASDDVRDAYNRWYDEEHSKQVLGLPGVRSCRRFELASTQILPSDDAMGRTFLALYEVEVDDWASLSAAMQGRFVDGRITVDPELLELDPMVKTMVFEALGPPIATTEHVDR
jgi:hypothetical protein